MKSKILNREPDYKTNKRERWEGAKQAQVRRLKKKIEKEMKITDMRNSSNGDKKARRHKKKTKERKKKKERRMKEKKR